MLRLTTADKKCTMWCTDCLSKSFTGIKKQSAFLDHPVHMDMWWTEMWTSTCCCFR